MWYMYTMEYYSALKKNNTICCNMDGHRDYHTMWSMPEKDKYSMLSLYVKSKKIESMNLYMKQKQIHRHRKQIYSYQQGRGEGDKLGVWDVQIYTTIYKIDKQ